MKKLGTFLNLIKVSGIYIAIKMVASKVFGMKRV